MADFAVTYDFVNGNVADADEVNTNFGDVERELNYVKNTNQLLANTFLFFQYNDSISGFKNMKDKLKKGHSTWALDYETLESTSEYDSSTSTCKYYDEVGCFIADLYDACNDNNVDDTKWTTATDGSDGSVYEDTFLRIDGGSNGWAYAYAHSLDFSTTNSSCIFRVTSNGGTCKVRITDGSSHIEVTAPYLGVYELYFDVSSGTVKYRYKTSKTSGWSNWSSSIDISSLNNWYVEFYSNGHLAINGMYYIQGEVTQSFYSNAETLNITANKACLVLNYWDELGTATITPKVSADNGSNYTIVNLNRFTTITNPGSQIICRVDVTTNATKPVYIYEYFVCCTT